MDGNTLWELPCLLFFHLQGWALYAEALGEDMGVYTAPNSL